MENQGIGGRGKNFVRSIVILQTGIIVSVTWIDLGFGPASKMEWTSSIIVHPSEK